MRGSSDAEGEVRILAPPPIRGRGVNGAHCNCGGSVSLGHVVRAEPFASRLTGMDVLIQVPIVDLRSFLAAPTGRLARPGWPVGLVADVAGHSQFLRGFSSLRDTLGSETGGWEGRAQHVDASRAVKLPADFGRALQAAVTRRLMGAPAPHDFFATCQSRAFYGSQTSARNFFQLRLVLNDPGQYELGHFDSVADALFELPVRVGTGSAVPLMRVGPALARYLRRQTTKRTFPGRAPTWSVTSGRLLLGFEVMRRDKDVLPAADTALRCRDGTTLHCLENSAADIWIVCLPEGRRASRSPSEYMLHLSRLHSERVTLTKLAEAIAIRRLSIHRDSGPGWDLLQLALDDAAGYLNQRTKFGHDQRSMLELLQNDLRLHAPQWQALQRTLSTMRPAVAHNVVQALTIIEGDQVGGDKFENVSGSTIVSRSIVQSAFNELSAASMDDLRAELEELLNLVQQTGNPEAADLAQSFVEESAGARRGGVLKALWTRLQAIAPVVGGLAAAGTAIAQILAL